VVPNFIPPLKNNLQAMRRRMAENLPWRNNHPGGPARRRVEKIPVELGF